VGEAAVAVVIGRGLELAEEVEAAMQAVSAARTRLAGLDRIWLNGPIKLPHRVIRALGGTSAGVGPWGDALKALAVDPDAAL
jgi:hypothetical protein